MRFGCDGRFPRVGSRSCLAGRNCPSALATKAGQADTADRIVTEPAAGVLTLVMEFTAPPQGLIKGAAAAFATASLARHCRSGVRVQAAVGRDVVGGLRRAPHPLAADRQQGKPTPALYEAMTLVTPVRSRVAGGWFPAAVWGRW